MKKFHRPGLAHSVLGRASVAFIGAMKLAHMAEMSEEEFERLLKKIEENRFFQLLKDSGVVNLAEFPKARYAARRFAGYGLNLSAGDLPELVDGKSNLVALIQGIGQERFESCFLKDASMSDVERADECDISVQDAVRLRDFVNRAFIQAEFEGAAGAPASKVFSSVAGIEIENGEPVLAFFHREIWKGRYKVDQERLSEILKDMPVSEQSGVKKMLKRMELVDKRKTTLYRALEILIKIQTDYLLTGEPARRCPFSQKTLSKNLEVHASVLNRLVSNKSIQLPWGTETPISTLLPSSKEVNIERLYSLASENPTMSDEGLRIEIKNLHGVELSRRSVAQYRKDLRISTGGHRSPTTTNNP
ncbi:MAG: hypothetical protein HY746_04195 [Elusimicrobia bacterium]|nr:hypothetical protein [Elusimicrobiota bacterium]